MPSLPGEGSGWSHLHEILDMSIDLDMGNWAWIWTCTWIWPWADTWTWGTGRGEFCMDMSLDHCFCDPGISPGVVHGHLSSLHVPEPLVLLLSCFNSCSVLIL